MEEYSIRTPKGRFTAQEALASDLDMLPVLYSPEANIDFKRRLSARTHEIEETLSRHLHLSPSEFVLSPPSKWICGGFNLCLFIDIGEPRRSNLPKRALIRFPVAPFVGESFEPGNVEEKLRSEAATYIWLRRSCPVIPIPRLLAMGFPGTQTFTAIENETLLHWAIWQLRRGWAWLRGATLAPYYSHQRQGLTDLGYLLLECVEEGQMLSRTFEKHRHDATRQANLFDGLARIMLGLAKTPLPRIGSWTMDDRGIISLTNRPLSDLTMMWSRHRIPTPAPRHMTYASADTFVYDLIAHQDNRLRHQPNAILSARDGVYQLSVLVALKSMVSRFWNESNRNGPFVLTLPDLHQSNIFVDDDWNIKRIFDLEFAPVCPLQMAHVPHWLTGQGVDGLDGQHLEDFKALYDAFVDTVERHETAGHYGHAYSASLREDMSTGRYWLNLALGSINAFPTIAKQHLLPMFYEGFNKADADVLFRLWDAHAPEFVAAKVADNEQYRDRVFKLFDDLQALEEEDVEDDDEYHARKQDIFAAAAAAATARRTGSHTADKHDHQPEADKDVIQACDGKEPNAHDLEPHAIA